MKIPVLLFAALFSVSIQAGIVGTNLLNLGSYSAGTNASVSFVLPQTHQVNPSTFTFYHSVTNSAFPSTNILEVTFDGGNTWATIGTYVDGTNSQTDIWNPSLQSLTASNRVRTITTTNQTLYGQANWNQ